MGRMAENCERHEGERAISRCSRCGKMICRKCQQEFGYFCSEECRSAKREEAVTPEFEQSHAENKRMQEKVQQNLRLVTRRVFPALVGILTLYIVVLCVSQKGKVQWRMASPLDVPFTTSAISEDGIYIGTESKKVLAISEAGTQLWEKELADPVTKIMANDSKYILVITQSRIDLSALGKISGNDDDKDRSDLTPRTTLLAMEKETGNPVWQKTISVVQGTYNALADETLYTLTANYGVDEKPRLSAFSVENGELRWEAALENGFHKMMVFPGGVAIASTSAIRGFSSTGKSIYKIPASLECGLSSDGTNLCIASPADLACYALNTGKELWRKELDTDVSSPGMACGCVLLGSLKTAQYSQEQKATMKKALKSITKNAKGIEVEDFTGDLDSALDAGRIEETIHAFSTSDGTLLWTKKKIDGIAIPSNNHLILQRVNRSFSLLDQTTSQKTYFDVLDPASGDILWTYEHPAQVQEVYAMGDRLYISGCDGTGDMVPSFSLNAPKTRGNHIAVISLKW